MLPLYGLPSLSETRSKSVVYSVRLLIMYMTYRRYSSIITMLQSLNWETLQSHRFHMCLCIIYKAYHNLTMFLILDCTTPATIQIQGNNIKFIQGLNTLSYLLHSGVGMSSHSSSAGYILGPVKGQSPKCYTLMLHWTVYLVLSCLFLFVKCTFFLIVISFSAHHVFHQYWWLMIDGR